MKAEILLCSGAYIDLENPQAEVMTPEVIARALSRICRFTGHTSRFYSVAEHSYRMSYLVPPAFALEALMHDAAEAFVGDMAKPLKNQLWAYTAYEEGIWAELSERYQLPLELSPEIKHADLVMLKWEKRDLMPATNEQWPILAGIEMPDETIENLGPEPDLDWEREWLCRFEELSLHLASPAERLREQAAVYVEANLMSDAAKAVVRLIRQLPLDDLDTLQATAREWNKAVGNEDDKGMRLRRFAEEAAELCQAGGLDRKMFLRVVNDAYDRPVGEFGQEVGGVGVTLMCLCAQQGVSVDAEFRREMTRIDTPEMIERIRAKQAEKKERGL
jgi:hypothetical protein